MFWREFVSSPAERWQKEKGPPELSRPAAREIPLAKVTSEIQTSPENGPLSGPLSAPHLHGSSHGLRNTSVAA